MTKRIPGKLIIGRKELGLFQNYWDNKLEAVLKQKVRQNILDYETIWFNFKLTIKEYLENV